LLGRGFLIAIVKWCWALTFVGNVMTFGEKEQEWTNDIDCVFLNYR